MIYTSDTSLSLGRFLRKRRKPSKVVSLIEPNHNSSSIVLLNRDYSSFQVTNITKNNGFLF